MKIAKTKRKNDLKNLNIKIKQIISAFFFYSFTYVFKIMSIAGESLASVTDQIAEIKHVRGTIKGLALMVHL